MEQIFEEMSEWAKSGIWYAHLTTLDDNLQSILADYGFSVYEYFGETGVSWSNAEFGGKINFEPDKHLNNLEAGDLLFGTLNGESLNFYIQDNTTARIGNSMFTVNIIQGVINKELQIRRIQKKSYWDD